MSWSPCGQVLVSGETGRARIDVLNALNCTHLASLEHADVVNDDDFVTSGCAVFEEREGPAEDIDGKIIQVVVVDFVPV